jgi:very-short-patch-repair endonuclease
VGVAHGVREHVSLRLEPPTRPAFGRPPSPQGGGIRKPQPLAGKAIACEGVLLRGAALANENARALRKRLTPQEVKLWVKLRELKLLGFHFRRQAPIGRYIVDFVSFRSQLIIEADGGQHGMPEGARSDQATPSCSRRVLEFFDSGIQTSMSISLA